MKPDAVYVYDGLLRYNYFPMVKFLRDDIPPAFSTEGFTSEIADFLIAGQDAKAAGKDPRGGEGFDQIEYRTTRFNNVSRLMHIPHPNPYARLCKCISANWSHLEHISDNPHSLIKPQKHGGGRLVVISEYESMELGRVVVMERDRFPDQLMLHIKLSRGARYLVEADVSACFPSLYTHALPWALVGHSTAKASKGRSHAGAWFNQLDERQRMLKRNETQGVPVGPATSNIMNEIVLEKVDQALAKDGYEFIRTIDDYRCYVQDRNQAEKFVRDLERELSLYLFSLNARKVSITELPHAFRADWITELAGSIPPTGKLSPKQIADYFDFATQLQRNHEDGSVVKYAFRSVARRLDKNSAEIFIEYCLHIAYYFPVVLPILYPVLRRWLVPITARDLHLLIERHMESRRSDAVSWSLCITRLANRRISDELADAIIASHDCIPITTFLALDRHTERIIDFVNGLSGRTNYELDQYWLPIYELTRRGVKLPADIEQYVRDTGLELLDAKKVTFLKRILPLKSRKELEPHR